MAKKRKKKTKLKKIGQKHNGKPVVSFAVLLLLRLLCQFVELSFSVFLQGVKKIDVRSTNEGTIAFAATN